MENKKMYNFIAKIALEYRLSLANICKLLGKEPNDKNKLEVYEVITSIIQGDELKLAYDFLFNYETVNEDEKGSTLAFSKALIFLKRYAKAQNSGNTEEVKLILKELTRTEEAFDKIKKKQDFANLSEAEVLVISKYRLKYCISKLRMTTFLQVGKSFLTRNEEKLNDNRLKEKLNLVSSFYEDLYTKNNKSKI